MNDSEWCKIIMNLNERERRNTNGKSASRVEREYLDAEFYFHLYRKLLHFCWFSNDAPNAAVILNKLGGSDQLIGFVVGIFTLSALLIRP